MEDQTTILQKPDENAPDETLKVKSDESHFFSISLRGLITLTVVWTVCGMSVAGLKIEEPLYTLVGLCVGYYFGQGNKPKSQTQ